MREVWPPAVTPPSGRLPGFAELCESRVLLSAGDPDPNFWNIYVENEATRNGILAQSRGIWVQHMSLGFASPVAASGEVTSSGSPTPMSALAESIAATKDAPAADATTEVASLVAAPADVRARSASAATEEDANSVPPPAAIPVAEPVEDSLAGFPAWAGALDEA